MKGTAKPRRLRRTLAARREEIIVKNFYQYTGPGGQTLHGYERQYKGFKLRKKGFVSKSDAEKYLRQAMNDIDARERGEVRCKPTTAQEALSIYRRNLEVRARDKEYQYAHNVKSNCRVLQEFVDHFGPNRLIRECTETDLREFYQILCFRPTINPESCAFVVHMESTLNRMPNKLAKNSDSASCAETYFLVRFLRSMDQLLFRPIFLSILNFSWIWSNVFTQDSG